MAGGVGLFGTTYTIANSGGYIYNMTIKSAEYSIERFNLSPESAIIPKADEKLLILHLAIQNPKKDDSYISGSAVSFSTVGLDDITRNTCSPLRRASAKAELNDTLKPGQKFPEDILVALTVPAVGQVPKLILNMGRLGTSDSVIRFALGKGSNVVKPLPAPYADPTDTAGATALAVAPAKIGVSYATGHNDIDVTSIAYVPGPIGEQAAGDGNQFLVATMIVTSKRWSSIYTKDFISAKLTTDDDEKTDKFILLKGKRDEAYEGRQLDTGDTMTVRIAFAIPTKAKGTKLKIAEVLDNTNSEGHALMYDLSAVK